MRVRIRRFRQDGKRENLAQGWVDDPPPQSRCLFRACLHRVCHPSALSSLFGPSLSAPRSPLPWHATSQDTTQLSPDKNVSGRCTSAAFTRSPGSQDFVVLCQLVPGTRACSAVRVPRLATRSPASFRPHLAVTPLPWTGSYPHVSCDA